MQYGIIESPKVGIGSHSSGFYVNLIPAGAQAASYSITLPPALPGSQQALVLNTDGTISYQSLGGGGTVTSVGLAAPSIFSVSGSPITTTGELTLGLQNQNANLIFAAPDSASGAPTFRSLAWGDVSGLSGTTATSFALGNDTRFHDQNTDTGTTSPTFQLNSGATGFQLKDSAGVCLLRNAADSGFADLEVGNLTVRGTTLSVQPEEVTIADNIILLNSNVTGTPTENGGVELERGTETNVSLALWDEVNDRVVSGLVGSELAIARVYETTFTSASLVGGALTVNHNLGRKVCAYAIADDTDKKIQPDDITFTSTNSLTIDLTNYTVSGTWTVVITG